MMNKAMISNGWELHIVNGHLFITSEQNADLQVRLNAEATYDLFEYLYQHRDELYQASYQQKADEIV